VIDVGGRRVLFVLDSGPAFTGRDYRTSGVGGTESCVVLLSEALATRGAMVVVANRVTAPVTDAGVRYVPLSAIGPDEFELVVLWKHWSDAAANRGTTRIFIWTDVHIPDPANLERCRAWAHVSLTLSEFQRTRLAAATGAAGLETLGAPIEVADYADAPPLKEHILLYCSVPDRGLYYLKDLFPAIRRRVPDTRLVITSDFTLWGARPAKEAFLKYFSGQAGVEYVGHVSRPELVEWQRRARVMAYPCTFEEGFCLSAAECMAAGAVPVTTGASALVTTVADGGVLVKGRPRSWFYRRRFVRACVELLTDDERWRDLVSRGRTRALREYAPATVVDKLLAAVDRARQSERIRG
jgi:glycosyltransferase involved in cell wall biosynthesis